MSHLLLVQQSVYISSFSKQLISAENTVPSPYSQLRLYSVCKEGGRLLTVLGDLSGGYGEASSNLFRS